MRPHSQLSAGGGFSHHKSVYHLSMGELLAAQKMDKSSRMGMAPTRTIEEGGTEDIRRLMKSCVDGVLDLSAGEGLSEDGFASLIWGLNDVTENDVCPIKTVIFQCREHLSAQQRESLVAVMGLVVEFSDAQASGHAVPALPLEEPADTPPGAPLNAPMNAPMTSPMTSPMNSPLNGPSVSTDPGPQDSPAARYWSTLLKECREKFSADACAQGSPEALSKTKASVQEAVASRCSGDGVPPTLDLSGENIDTVAIWVIEAALAHWLMPIQTLRLGPLGGLDAEQRVSLLLTCLDSESLKENAGCLDLKACAGPRSSGAPDEAGQSAAWVFSPADLAAYQKVGTGEKQVSLELDPAVIAPDALPGLRELVDAGRPIKGLPPVRAEPELQTPAQPTHQGPRAPSVDELLQRNADFRQLYEQVRGRLAQADEDTIAQWLEGCRMPPQEWAALKSLARTVAGHAQILAYEIPARPVKTEKKQRLSEGLFDERFGRFR